jgi:hypothetical protein
MREEIRAEVGLKPAVRKLDFCICHRSLCDFHGVWGRADSGGFAKAYCNRLHTLMSISLNVS